MNAYEYGDETLKVVVQKIDGSSIGIGVHQGMDGYTRFIPRQEAPAIALAILRAAGVPDNIASESPEKRAVGYLLAWQVARDARDSEDAKVRAFIEATIGGTVTQVSDLDRDFYRKAHDHFKERP